MSKKLNVHAAAIAAFLAASMVSGAALAVDEVEQYNTIGLNNSIGTAQELEIGPGGTVTVNGAIGAPTFSSLTPMTRDVDYYIFKGNEGNTVQIDIDGGAKPTGQRSVDTNIAVFGPCGFSGLSMCAKNDDATNPLLDDGSISDDDSRINMLTLPKTGSYIVGVASISGSWQDDGTFKRSSVGIRGNGTYKLTISGVLPLVQQINIAIKPGSGASAPINPNSKGSLPVALLGSAKFNPLTVDYVTLLFGATGNEDTRLRCAREGEDVNSDGFLDLMCHFDFEGAEFQPGDSNGIVKGMTRAKLRFEGHGLIHIAPKEKKD